MDVLHVVTIDYIPGHAVLELKGQVRGFAVAERAKDTGAQEEARDSIATNAEKLGANAVLGTQFVYELDSTCSDIRYCYAIGTAVVIRPVN